MDEKKQNEMDLDISIDIHDENRLKQELEEIRKDKDYEIYNNAFKSFMKKVNSNPDILSLPQEEQKVSMLELIKQEREKKCR